MPPVLYTGIPLDGCDFVRNAPASRADYTAVTERELFPVRFWETLLVAVVSVAKKVIVLVTCN